jgi:ATP-dependent DNA helicase RecG
VEGKNIVELLVYKGQHTPYTYNGAAYKRSDTSTVPVDSNELRLLSLEGVNFSYDQLPSTENDLSFTILRKFLKEKAGLKRITDDTWHTLGLMRKNYYTRAGQLLSDENTIHQSATSIVRFGQNISVFLDRVDIIQKSLLIQYREALNMFDKWYAPYEQIIGFERVQRDQIPREAYREGVVNALVHRRFDLNSAVQISMHDDRVEIVSPGGLPSGISEVAYLYGQVSLIRNITLAEVFHRIGLIEKFGTGILRIREEYSPYAANPKFDVTDDHIRVILPVIDYDAAKADKDIDLLILDILANKSPLSRAELEDLTGFKRSWMHQALKNLVDHGVIVVVGGGPQTKYKIKS